MEITLQQKMQLSQRVFQFSRNKAPGWDLVIVN